MSKEEKETHPFATRLTSPLRGEVGGRRDHATTAGWGWSSVYKQSHRCHPHPAATKISLREIKSRILPPSPGGRKGVADLCEISSKGR